MPRESSVPQQPCLPCTLRSHSTLRSVKCFWTDTDYPRRRDSDSTIEEGARPEPYDGTGSSNRPKPPHFSNRNGDHASYDPHIILYKVKRTRRVQLQGRVDRINKREARRKAKRMKRGKRGERGGEKRKGKREEKRQREGEEILSLRSVLQFVGVCAEKSPMSPWPRRLKCRVSRCQWEPYDGSGSNMPGAQNKCDAATRE